MNPDTQLALAVGAFMAVVIAALCWHRRRRREQQAATQATCGGIRVAENYANYDSVRHVVDTNHQPRKEKP